MQCGGEDLRFSIFILLLQGSETWNSVFLPPVPLPPKSSDLGGWIAPSVLFPRFSPSSSLAGLMRHGVRMT